VLQNYFVTITKCYFVTVTNFFCDCHKIYPFWNI